MRKISAFIFGAALGGFLAAMVALLLAPASGTQLRSRLHGYTKNLVEEIRSAAVEKRQQLEEELAKLRTAQS